MRTLTFRFRHVSQAAVVYDFRRETVVVFAEEAVCGLGDLDVEETGDVT
jgi:hypothetical protein